MPVIRFFKKLAFFLLLNGVILVAVLWFFSGRNRHLHMDNWQTESNLLVLGENQHYGVALLGTSRGRVFSRDGNHQMVEQILGQKVINLSKGGGGGLMPAELHLAYFYFRGNQVDQVIYLVDPWVFFSPINNDENHFFLRDEPFELFILWKLVIDGYPTDQMMSYLQKITVTDWASVSRYAAPGLTAGTLAAVDQEKIDKAREHYRSRYRENGFEKYSRFVDTIDALVGRHNGRITYVMLPILIPDFPGMDQVDEKLRQAARQNRHVAYVDLSKVMQDRRYFYDHMHFNKAGIAHFTRKYLLTILQAGPHGFQPLSDRK